MTDTPRTDEAEANAIASGIPISMVCRQLERELNQAIKERDEALKKLQTWKEMDDFRAKMFSEMSGAKCTTLGELHDYVINAIKERDEARECLREILGGFGVCGCHVPSLYATGTRSQIEIDRWRKAAGLTNIETDENAPIVNRDGGQ